MARVSSSFLFIILVVFPVPWMELRAEAKICYNIIPNIVPCNLGGCQRLCKFLHYEKARESALRCCQAERSAASAAGHVNEQSASSVDI